MKRAEVWQGYEGEWYVLTTRCRPRYLRRTERIADSAFPEDYKESDENPFPTHEEALHFALAEVGLGRRDTSETTPDSPGGTTPGTETEGSRR